MDNKLFLKCKVAVIVLLAVISNIRCHVSKEITPQSAQYDTLSSFKGNSGFFIDKRDGQKYKWVRIGEQIWMAENLAFKADSGCVAFQHKERKAKKYGYYYSWETAMKSCPVGWHLPTEEDIKNLKLKLGDSDYYDAFDSLKKHNDYGLNFRRTGFYSLKDNQFHLYYKFPFLGESYFWTGYLVSNASRAKSEPCYFYIQFFWRRASIDNYNSENYYLPARCVKD
jgi:uncharacterized protein (TIGR02145 family)